jgi:hypothetical protein
MLHSRRTRLAALAEAEAAGESFWTASFDEAIRNRLFHLFKDASRSESYFWDCAESAQKLILREEGLLVLVDGRRGAGTDFILFLRQCPDAMMPTVIEAFVEACSRNVNTHRHKNTLVKAINGLLREHRISYEIVDDQIVEFSSRELHTSIVAPTLNLVSNSERWSKVESAYRDALKEISASNPADAITDAGTALQQTLELLGCEGNSLGPLIKSARKKGLITNHDAPMVEAIERVMHWASANRSERGDAHTASNASIADAWLMVHVVGAVILRLSRDFDSGS